MQTMSTLSHIVNNSLHHVYFFPLIFPHVLGIFTLITILGNVHRLCKHYPNIVNNNICHVYSFFLKFPNFLAIFSLIPIFRNAHRPCNQCHTIITNSKHHPYFLSILLLFCMWKCKTCHIWQFLASIPVMHSSRTPESTLGTQIPIWIKVVEIFWKPIALSG